MGALIIICFFPLLVQAESIDDILLLRVSISDFITGDWLAGTSRFTFIPHKDFRTTTISHMNEALWEWNHNLPSGIEGVYRDSVVRHSATDYPTKDGINRIYRKNIYSTDYVGQATWYTVNGITTEADINLNMYYNWANSAQPNAFDLWTVFLHEAGHVYGLSDIDPDNAANDVYKNRVMYGKVAKNTTKRYITSAEVNILQFIYS